MDANFPTPSLLDQPEPSPSYGLAAYEEELTADTIKVQRVTPNRASMVDAARRVTLARGVERVQLAPISKPSKKPVYWSSLGKQPVSTRASSPTFSFGTSAAREAPRIGTSRFGPQRELVAVGSKHDGIVSPGPTRYNVAESTPPAKRGATYRFGTEAQRAPLGGGRHSGAHLSPGPAKHVPRDGIGARLPLSPHTSSSRFTIRTRYAQPPIQPQEPGLLVPGARDASPPFGPASLESRLAGVYSSPGSSPVGMRQSGRYSAPGPGSLRPSKSAGALSPVRVGGRHYTTHNETYSGGMDEWQRSITPGPKYVLPSPLGKQLESGRRSPPRYGFGSSAARVALPVGAAPHKGDGQLMPSSWGHFETPGAKY